MTVQPNALASNPNTAIAGMFTSPSHYLARTGADALLGGGTTPALLANNNIQWTGGATGLLRMPIHSGIGMKRTAGGFGAALYLWMPVGAVAVTIEITMLISVGSVGSVTPPVFAPTTYTRTFTAGGDYLVSADDSGVLIFEQMPAAIAGTGAVMVCHGVEIDVTANDTDVNLYGVGIRA